MKKIGLFLAFASLFIAMFGSTYIASRNLIGQVSDNGIREKQNKDFIAEINDRECKTFGNDYIYNSDEITDMRGTMFINCVNNKELDENGRFKVETKELSVAKSYYYLNKYSLLKKSNLSIYDNYVASFSGSEVPNPYNEKVDKEKERDLLLRLEIKSCINSAVSNEDFVKCVNLSLTGSEQK